MANPDSPFGFQHVGSLVADSEAPLEKFTVDSSNATAIFRGDPLTLEADGNVAPSAGGAGPVVGAVARAFENEQGKQISFLPATTAGTVLGVPVKSQVFTIQSDSGTVVNLSDKNATADFIAGTGDTVTGTSKYELDSSSIGTGQQLRIIDKQSAVGQENNFGDEHVNLRVVFVEDAYSDNTTI